MNKEKRLEVYNKYQGNCAYCGKKIELKDMQVDHIMPKRLWENGLPDGRNIDDDTNLNPSCRRCNHYKRANTLEGYRKLIITLHERIRKQYLSKVAEDYKVIIVKPWDGKFYFEKVGNRES